MYNKYTVKYAGICGSDINKARDNSFIENDILKFGHEIVCESDSGELFVVNPFVCDSRCSTCNQKSFMYCDNVTRLGAGDVEGGFSGKVNIKSENLYKIPKTSHPEIGVFCDGIAVVFHGLHMIQLQSNQRLAIIGAGSIGVLSAVIIKEIFPHHSIDIFYKSRQKKEYLQELFGNTFSYHEISKMNICRNCYDVVIEAVGGKQIDTIDYSIDMVKNSGSILVFGAFNDECKTINRLRQLFYKQIKLIGINSFCKEYDDFQRAVNWAFSHERLLSSLITDFYVVCRNRIDAKKVYQSVLAHKLLKGCIVYE